VRGEHWWPGRKAIQPFRLRLYSGLSAEWNRRSFVDKIFFSKIVGWSKTGLAVCRFYFRYGKPIIPEAAKRVKARSLPFL